MDGPALEAIGVSKRYGFREALRGVDLIAQPGRLHGLLGPNGAGKTTLLRVLLGLVRCDAGTVRLLGSRLDGPAGRLPRGVAGFVETPAFYPYLSGRSNLELLARLDSVAWTGVWSAARWRTETRSAPLTEVGDALEQVGLAAEADIKVAGYSAGMRQRLGLAAALLRSPRLLLLDEPTSSLDPAGARDMRDLARRAADKGAAVLFSSHDMSEVEALCSDLTVIDRGRVIFAGTVDELRRLAPPAVHALRTSDDRAALNLASQRNLKAMPAAGGGLEVSADTDVLDAYVIALGNAGIAVRALEYRVRSLESLFLELTGHAHANKPALADEFEGASVI